MNDLLLIVCSLFILSSLSALSAEENFLLLNGISHEVIVELGPRIDQQMTPCSTFKIALSLMGYDAGILKNSEIPTWDFEEGYEDYFDSWKASQTPLSWIRSSCIWYSKLLTLQLGLEKIQTYLISLEYGNHDLSVGLIEPGLTNPGWIKSSLKISPKEQVAFIQKMIQGKFPIADKAVQMTKTLLFKETWSEGWLLFGKTGGCRGFIDEESGGTLQLGWFVGWIEKEHQFFPFAYLICAEQISFEQRIPRVKQLLMNFKSVFNNCSQNVEQVLK